MTIIEVVVLVISIVGLIPLYIDLIFRMRERRISLILQRVNDQVKKPIESNWGIRILHSDKVIEQCKIFYDDTPLPLWDKKQHYYEKLIEQGGGGIVRMVMNMENEDEDRYQRRKETTETIQVQGNLRQLEEINTTTLFEQSD